MNKKTTEEHRLEGTQPRSRSRLGAVVSGSFASSRPATKPRTPSGLSADSRRLWTRILQEFEITSAPTLELLESALRSRDVAEQARRTLEAEGLTYLDSAGKPKAHPATTIHRDARAAFVTTMRVLGFPAEDK